MTSYIIKCFQEGRINILPYYLFLCTVQRGCEVAEKGELRLVVNVFFINVDSDFST